MPPITSAWIMDGWIKRGLVLHRAPSGRTAMSLKGWGNGVVVLTIHALSTPYPVGNLWPGPFKYIHGGSFQGKNPVRAFQKIARGLSAFIPSCWCCPVTILIWNECNGRKNIMKPPTVVLELRTVGKQLMCRIVFVYTLYLSEHPRLVNVYVLNNLNKVHFVNYLHEINY